MIKFNEFKSNGKNKKNRLKKVKNNDLAIERRKKEIQKRMNVYVNGSSSFSNDVGRVFEKKLDIPMIPCQ
jgi:Ethanolamine utilization protein EutJ (predicted chaperonin)